MAPLSKWRLITSDEGTQTRKLKVEPPKSDRDTDESTHLESLQVDNLLVKDGDWIQVLNAHLVTSDNVGT